MKRAYTLTAPASLALMLLAGCGGGTSTSPSALPSSSTGTTASGGATASAQAATGVWEGTVTSQATGQTVRMFGVVDGSGMGAWMTTDGRVLAGATSGMTVGGQMPMTAYVDGGASFPNGANGGPMTFMLDAMASGTMSGRMAGLGDTFTMSAKMDLVWNRPASLATIAGVYSRATSSGYTVSMSISANGMLTANDSRGCAIGGTVTVPDPTHNLYKLAATVTSCGALNGSYTGSGTLVDATAMTTWMQQMMPIAHDGTTSAGMGGSGTGGMMNGSGGGMMSGQNTVPSGSSNLFMFMLVNDHHAIMDAVAR